MSKGNKCSGYWLIDSKLIGECIKLYPNKDLTACICCDTGKCCPYNGTRDFGKLQDKTKGVPEWMNIKASRGGKRSHK